MPDITQPQQRIGAYLSQLVPLTPHDIEEVLSEQVITQQRFGDAALSLGLCEPHQLWKAWVGQLTHSTRTIDLASVGIDMQALCYVPAHAAQRLQALPIRASDEELIVAVGAKPTTQERAEIEALSRMKAIFVLTDPNDLQSEISRCYGLAKPAAA